jgi:hypothetical protein
MLKVLDRRSETERVIDERIKDILDGSHTVKEIHDVIGLVKARNELRSALKQTGIKSETIFVEVMKFGAVVLILNHEKIGIITSKAFGYVLRGRV